jgi:hypothetical protein
VKHLSELDTKVRFLAGLKNIGLVQINTVMTLSRTTISIRILSIMTFNTNIKQNALLSIMTISIMAEHCSDVISSECHLC